MRGYQLLALGMLMAAGGCHLPIGELQAMHQTKGDGPVVTETRSAEAFDSIEHRGAMDVQWRPGAKISVVIKTQKNLQSLVKTRVVDRVLIIDSKGSYSTNQPMTVMVTSPTLNAFELGGSGNATLERLAAKAFTLKLTGSGNIDASGACASLDASIDGSGNITASSLKADSATAAINGSGNISVRAMKNLNASVNGSGSIEYFGKPSLTKSINGSGSVEPGGD